MILNSIILILIFIDYQELYIDVSLANLHKIRIFVSNESIDLWTTSNNKILLSQRWKRTMKRA